MSVVLSLFLGIPLENLATAAPKPPSTPTSIDLKTQAEYLYQAGIQRVREGDRQGGVDKFQQAFPLFRKGGDRRREADTLFLIASNYVLLEQVIQAPVFYKQALEIYRDLKDRPREADTLNALGNAYFLISQYPQASEFYQQALVIRQQLGDRPALAHNLSRLGGTYETLGQYAKALDAYQQSLAIYEQLQDRINQASVLSKLGSTFSKRGEYPKALESYRQALAIYEIPGQSADEKLRLRQGEWEILSNLGVIYTKLGQFRKGSQALEQAAAIWKEIYPEETGQIPTSAGESNPKPPPSQLEAAQQELALYRKLGNRFLEASALATVAQEYFRLGQYPQAFQFYRQAQETRQAIGDRAGEALTLILMGFAYEELQQYPQALQVFQQALAIAQKIGDQPNVGLILSRIGAVQKHRGQLAAATQTLQAATQVFESLRVGLTDANKVSIFETQSYTYSLLQQVLVAQQQTEAALEVTERSKARAFAELLAQRLGPTPTEPVTLASPSLAQIKQIAQDRKATLVEYSVIYDRFQVQGKTQNQASELYIWVIQPTGRVTFRSVDLKPLFQQQKTSLEALVLSVRESIAGERGLIFKENPTAVARAIAQIQAQSHTNPQLQQLYQLLIQPIADLLPTDPKAHVVLIPHKALFMVPFAALQNPMGTYLIEQHTLLHAPSIQVLALTHQQRQRLKATQPQSAWVAGLPKTAVVVGNPTMPQVVPAPGKPAQQLMALPGAEAEAKVIASLLHTQAMTGNQADKASVVQKMLQASLIHLATHGLLDEVRGLGSAIALAPSSGKIQDDGLLTAEEILNLKLKAELVVLSACDTGRGRITGDGVIGLSRSFISAGVPSIVVSLWAIPDTPTAALMPVFYENLKRNPDKAQALRQAMLKTMKKYPRPQDWAAFVLMGEAK
ncbi:MAG: CHAT domain-containing tetratricopeptide repeat protein [Leptolyngbyaceae bacterium]|nr:CHAT domain-containing tetratricopeptide repeat protein [Leptolyngbyaceae bacterium]